MVLDKRQATDKYGEDFSVAVCVWARKQISSPFAINVYISNNPYPQKNQANWAANVFHWNVSLRNFFFILGLVFSVNNLSYFD